MGILKRLFGDKGRREQQERRVDEKDNRTHRAAEEVLQRMAELNKRLTQALEPPIDTD